MASRDNDNKNQITERKDKMKLKLCMAIGTIGAFFAHLLGGWDFALKALALFMLLDYFTGLAVGWLNKSRKTENGALSSEIGFIGFAKKIGILIAVSVACVLDKLAGSDVLRDAVIIAYITNEAISIIENLGIIGVPIPYKLRKAIEVLKEEEEKE